ncbi:hypothetical protein RHO15_08055 [Utexia brackfieldae]|uniref:hypothetical protein n=1 Tax=Utexia brackfieldae TaxID=3074108 RepID=UPI00370D3066
MIISPAPKYIVAIFSSFVFDELYAGENIQLGGTQCDIDVDINSSGYNTDNASIGTDIYIKTQHSETGEICFVKVQLQ